MKKIAEIKGISENEVAKITTENSDKVFCIELLGIFFLLADEEGNTSALVIVFALPGSKTFFLALGNFFCCANVP